MPMNGRSEKEIEQERDSIFKSIKLKLPEAKLIDSIIDGAGKEIELKGDSIGMWYLGKSIQIMCEADIIFFAKGWENARGCCIEKEIAEKYGKVCDTNI